MSAMKRLFDILFASLVLILLSPLYLLIALIIKFTSPGPVFYVAPRIGKNLKTIQCLKFRSMYVDAEEKLENLLASNPLLRIEWDTYWKLKKDPRITAIGKFLRKTSLDELPQFFNVLLGDLSVVGPRPALPEQVRDFYREKAPFILSVRPGITGPWQTSGRNSLTFEERISLEEEYAKKNSFFRDIFFILKTIPLVLFPRNTY
ncbi:MAG: UDP-glucose:undecaprenyl-phosphate glucose-1-phosphate transferase [Chlamydiia bacterium]|nr:UDP-glucose:undecaprenyl-phosphate glucose-1-phosphate transferase [Chlamydiia bacterium]MCH9616170.1 UDP-glucose:undecaprenyl-phosphate glucose-1-phosphate transferase [Chlamydiia bacterium]MCH9629844.1 UDP-glucose:undecaprenyl-phosphate glucose-1-phosphate transferase [Chlamydiia bacterium]